MSFYPQPNRYQCGPFALKYALVMLGIFKNENQIGIIAGSTWWAGTDEIGLARAARRFNCRMKHFSADNPHEAKKLLNQELKKGHPCVLSVSNWNHWLTVVNHTSGKYIVIDSELDKVISIQSPIKLMRKWKYADEEITSYDGYALYPKFKVQTRAKFTIQKAHELMLDTNDRLAKRWDQYFNDLITICRPRTKLTTNFITFKDFLRRNENQLIHQVANWHGNPSYAELKKILYNMKVIADIYDLIVPWDLEKRALIDLSSILMMYACGKYGMDKIY
ncbi:MAG: BtrH N-terminal domain-containing protein [Melioribacteraceae bacterium]|nr:BtrH N-terminal domain-containing protein [Melioribacteraceae bacterium]MCF8355882.1 BtrH N-terminal domain-containing protein [Melioribacteraceae bacterium]MCF8395209.1 BtrH N-terminal domain-containing protein [Melioribacteraceae bacterium]MCF8420683.1 BtrH N-terminal domain-containing protein [Melioribacteraceae bacterium]